MDAADFHELMRKRRAIRRYHERDVPLALVQSLLESAMWAPSAHNRQPWRFVVLTTPSAKHGLARAMGERLRKDRLRDGDPQQAIERDVARSYDRIANSPVVIVFFLSMADMDRYPDARRNEAERQMAVQSVAMAVQNLWLLASAEGLGACWHCAPLFVPELVGDTLSVAQDWEAQGLLTLGWPAEQPTKTRREWREFVRFL